MNNRWKIAVLITGLLIIASWFFLQAQSEQTNTQQKKAQQISESENKGKIEMSEKINKSNEEWRKILTPEQYKVMREKGTEPPFSGEYWNNKKDGIYVCAACGNPLFSSRHKFDSGTGWPSFWQPYSEESVATRPDNSWFMRRTEVVCSKCGSHLGHVFDDGPPPTGQRYCINSVALKFIPEHAKEKQADQ